MTSSLPLTHGWRCRAVDAQGWPSGVPSNCTGSPGGRVAQRVADASLELGDSATDVPARWPSPRPGRGISPASRRPLARVAVDRLPRRTAGISPRSRRPCARGGRHAVRRHGELAQRVDASRNVRGRSPLPLNCTGIPPIAKSLRSGWPSQSSGIRIRRQVGVVAELDAEHVEDLALHRLGARMQVEQRRHAGVGLGHLHPQADARAVGATAGRRRARTAPAAPLREGATGSEEVVDGGHVDAHLVAVGEQRLDDLQVASASACATPAAEAAREGAAVHLRDRDCAVDQRDRARPL